MRKFIKVFTIVIAVIVAVMFVTPFFLKDKITSVVKKQINQMLNATVDFGDVNISFFRAFPEVSVGIDKLSVIGNGCYEGDTLLSAARIAASVDIASFFGSEGIVIKEIRLDAPHIYARVNCESIPNWDIMKDEEEKETPETSSDDNMMLSLKRFIIKEGIIVYDDCVLNMKTELNDINMLLSGDMSADQTKLKSDLSVTAINMWSENVKYVSDMKFISSVDINANLKDNVYELGKNTISLNAIKTSLEGVVAVKDSSRLDLDIKFNTENVTFKEILSLVPAIYSKEFDKLEAKGDVGIAAWAKGEMYDDVLPAFDFMLNVKNGMFKYAGVPASVDNINIDLGANSKGGNADNVVAYIKRLHVSILGNSFDLAGQATNMVTDLSYEAAAKGVIDLSKISSVYPVEDMKKLTGVITSDLTLKGTLSQIEKQAYENIRADGSVRVQGFGFENNDLGKVVVDNARLNFSPKYVSLEDTKLKVKSSDVAINGRVENFIPYILKGYTVKGELDIASDMILMSDFVTPEPVIEKVEAEKETEAEKSDTAGVVVIPGNIDFKMNVNLKKVAVDRVILTDVTGKLTVAGGIADISSIKMNAFDGTVNMNGKYDTSLPSVPKADMNFNVNNASFRKSFESMESLQKIAPVFNNMTGRYSMSLGLKTDILPDFSPDLNSLWAKGTIKSSDVSVSGVEALDRMADLLNYDKLKTLSMKDLNLSFEIEKGRLSVNPFDIKAGTVTLTLGGSTGLDQTLDLKGKISIPSDNIRIMNMSIKNLPFTITGTVSNPNVSLDTKAMAADVATGAADKVKDIVADKLGIPTDSLSTMSPERKAEVMAEARRKADKMISDAEAEAKKLIEKAGNNPLLKIAAEKAAEKLKKEAQKQAEEVISNIENNN